MNSQQTIKRTTEASGKIKLTVAPDPESHAFLFEGKRTLHTFHRDILGVFHESKILYPTHAFALLHLKAFGNPIKMKAFSNYCKKLNNPQQFITTAHL